MFARACRFDGGVQGQQVGLVGDVVDDADFLGNLFHGRDGGGHGFAALGGLLGRLAGHAVGDFGVLGVLRNGGGHLLDRGAGFFHAGGLFAGGLRQGLRRDADLPGGAGEGFGGHQHLGDHAGHFADGVVDHGAEFAQIALVVAVDVERQVTACHSAHDGAHFVDGNDDRFQGGVDALDDLAEVPVVLGCIGAHRELALHRGLREQVGIGHQCIDGVDAGVEVVLQRVEIAVVGVGDLGGNGAARDVVHVLGGHVERANDRVQRVVDALHDLAEIALVLGGVGAGGQLALDGGLGQHARIGHQCIDGVDAGVEVVLQRVEIAVVGVGDLGGNGAARDVVHVLGGHVERANDRVQRVVDALHDLAEIALVLGGVGAGGQLALDGSLGQHARVRDHGLHRRLHGAQRLGQFADFVVLVQRQRVAEITGGHFIGVLHELVSGGCDAAGDQPAQCGTQRRGQHRQYQQQAFCVSSHLFCCLAPCLHQGVLTFCQGSNGSDVVGLAVAQGARQHAGSFFALACLDQADVFPHVLHINRTDILDLLQTGFAGIRGDCLLQFGNAFGDDAALL